MLKIKFQVSSFDFSSVNMLDCVKFLFEISIIWTSYPKEPVDIGVNFINTRVERVGIHWENRKIIFLDKNFLSSLCSLTKSFYQRGRRKLDLFLRLCHEYMRTKILRGKSYLRDGRKRRNGRTRRICSFWRNSTLDEEKSFQIVPNDKPLFWRTTYSLWSSL